MGSALVGGLNFKIIHYSYHFDIFFLILLLQICCLLRVQLSKVFEKFFVPVSLLLNLAFVTVSLLLNQAFVPVSFLLNLALIALIHIVQQLFPLL